MTEETIIKKLQELLETMCNDGDLQTAATVGNALDLIRRLYLKTEDLEVSLQAMRNVANGYKSAYERNRGSRNTAIKEFAEIVISDYPEMEHYLDILVKEMLGEQE